jgi:hypothetical protein
MKQEDAKRQIIRLWGKREKGKYKRIDVLHFYGYLERNYPNLLRFKYSGDKYQKIMSWLTPYIVE